MKKWLLIIPFILITSLIGICISNINSEVYTFEKDLSDSYHFSGFLDCKFPASLNSELKDIYKDSCKVSNKKDFDKFLNQINPFLSLHIHSPLMRMRAFRPYNSYLSITTNNEYKRLRDQLLSYAHTEQSQAMVNGNFIESDCSPGMMKKNIEYAESIHNQFTRMFILSEIKNCMFINNLDDPGLIHTLLSLSPSELEDESAGIIQLREYLVDTSFLLRMLPRNAGLSVADFFIPQSTRTTLTDLDYFFYLDEMSQLHYLKKEFDVALRYATRAMEMNIKKYKVENFEILNYMTLARLGKIYLQLGQKDTSLKFIELLDKENEIYKKLPEMYYIDLSLAELFLQSNDRRPALAYLETSYKKKYIPEHLFKKWVSEIETSRTAKLELDMFRFVNKKSIESKIFKNEENQIILFKDKLQLENKSLQ